MDAAQNAAFARLLTAWNHHQDLRYSSAELPTLSASYLALDDARKGLRAT